MYAAPTRLYQQYGLHLHIVWLLRWCTKHQWRQHHKSTSHCPAVVLYPVGSEQVLLVKCTAWSGCRQVSVKMWAQQSHMSCSLVSPMFSIQFSSDPTLAVCSLKFKLDLAWLLPWLVRLGGQKMRWAVIVSESAALNPKPAFSFPMRMNIFWS